MSMPEYLVRELISMNIAKFRGALETYKEECLRSTPGLYDAAFCKHNQVLETEFSSAPIFSKNAEVQMDKMIEAAKLLLNEKPLTTDEKVDALASLQKKPKA